MSTVEQLNATVFNLVVLSTSPYGTGDPPPSPETAADTDALLDKLSSNILLLKQRAASVASWKASAAKALAAERARADAALARVADLEPRATANLAVWSVPSHAELVRLAIASVAPTLESGVTAENLEAAERKAKRLCERAVAAEREVSELRAAVAVGVKHLEECVAVEQKGEEAGWMHRYAVLEAQAAAREEALNVRLTSSERTCNDLKKLLRKQTNHANQRAAVLDAKFDVMMHTNQALS
jgi:hypothetical protein